MKNLKKKDLQTLLDAVEHLHSDFDPRTLPERALKAAAKVIEADSVAFTGITYDGNLSGIAWDSSETISPEEVEIFGRFMHEQPLVTAFLIERRTETLKITDLMPAEKFERTNIYNEFYKRVGVRNQLVTPLSISKDLFVSCSANTNKRDFSDHSRLMATLLAPHLICAIRNALAYERLDAALDSEARGIIAVAADGKPHFVSEYARQLLDNYFPAAKSAGESLPEILSDWLKQANSDSADFSLPPAPLKIRNADGELIVRLMPNHRTRERTLLLEEKKLLSPLMFQKLNLTRRESEVLFYIAQGKSDDVIARVFGISPRTIHKHVENIYAKLGVETRTAAMLRALESL